MKLSSQEPAQAAYPAGFGFSGGRAARADEPAIASAADQAGGCVAMGFTMPYTPGAPDAPLVLTKPEANQPVEVDGYQGWAGAWTWTGNDFNGIPTLSGTTQQVLNLTVPAPGGQVQDLTIAAMGISEAQLLSIVVSGLTSPTTGTEGTSTVPVASTTAPSATTTAPAATTTLLSATTTTPPSVTTAVQAATTMSP